MTTAYPRGYGDGVTDTATDRRRWGDVDDDEMLNRVEVADLCDVQANTVRIWAQDLTFPDPIHVRGFRQVFHRARDVRAWLCATGRLDCAELADTLSLADVLARIGVAESTLKTWRIRGKFPPPDLRVQDKPRWKLATVKRWERKQRR